MKIILVINTGDQMLKGTSTFEISVDGKNAEIIEGFFGSDSKGQDSLRERVQAFQTKAQEEGLKCQSQQQFTFSTGFSAVFA